MTHCPKCHTPGVCPMTPGCPVLGLPAEPNEELRSRLVRAVIEELREDDQFLLIGIGERELRIRWENEDGQAPLEESLPPQ